MNRSNTAVGAELATKVAQLLEAGEMLAYRHRDYCGMGLRYAEGSFIYGEVDDGFLLSESEAKHLQEAVDSERRLFASRAAFVEWLSAQSDESLSGSHLQNSWLRNNQRITIDRLESFVGGRE